MNDRLFEGKIHQIKEINNFAGEAYKSIDSGNPYLYKEGVCHEVSDYITERCRTLGYPSVRLVGRSNEGAHSHVLIGNGWIADGTWQQFLNQPKPELPKVLVVNQKALEAFLSAYGVPEELHRLWLFAYPVN